nr:LysM peptidoglycan-binding domain-containing protein [Aquibacillus halophilus]
MWGKELLQSTTNKETTTQNSAGEIVTIIDTVDRLEGQGLEENLQIENTEVSVEASREKKEEQLSDVDVINEQGDTSNSKVEFYKVKQGDTLFSIAMDIYGSKQGEQLIADANNLQNRQVIIGQELIIPQADQNVK